MFEDDITFCIQQNCKNTECERHMSNIKDLSIPHSFSDFSQDEDYCPLFIKPMSLEDFIEYLKHWQTRIDKLPCYVVTTITVNKMIDDMIRHAEKVTLTQPDTNEVAQNDSEGSRNV